MDKSRISGAQFMFCIAFFLQSSSLLTSFLAGVTHQDSWVPVLLAGLLCTPLLLLYRTLMLTFPNKNFLQMMDTVFGPVAGKILGAGFVWFCITLAALNLKDMGNFTKLMVLEFTPHWALTLMCIIPAAWVVRGGLKILVRYGTIFTIMEFIVVFITILLIGNQIDLNNFLPMFQLPPMKYVQATHIISTIPLGELVVFLMMPPSVRLSQKDATRYWLGGAGMGIVTLLLVLLRDISVLGNTMPLFSMPGLVTLRLVNLGETLSRMEVLFSTMLILLLFFKVSVLLYVSTIGVCQLTGVRSFKHLALVLGVFLSPYCLTLFPTVIDHTTAAQQFIPFLWSIFEILLPLAVLIAAKLRGYSPAKAAVEG